MALTGGVDLTLPEARETRWIQVFADMPQDIEELTQKMDQKQEEAERIVCANMQVLEEYKKRKADIHRVETELTRENERCAVAQAMLQEKRASRRPSLPSSCLLLTTYRMLVCPCQFATFNTKSGRFKEM